MLKLRTLGELDIANLIEELEAMNEVDKAACRSYVAQIVTNKLRSDYWSSQSAVDKDKCSGNIHRP